MFRVERPSDDVTLYLGDCLDVMPSLVVGSVDMICTDPPYGTTECKWDAVIPFAPMWSHMATICKDNAPIVLMATQPFTTTLIASNIGKFRHAWTWNKVFAGNVMQAKRQPLKTVEDVLVFSLGERGPQYFPQMEKRDKPIKAGGLRAGEAAPNRSSEEAKAAIKAKVYDEKYPTSILTFSARAERGLHPTQKPTGLMEYLIRTYTRPGDLVLDCCMGSGTTGIAALNTGRRFIGIEKDPAHFGTALARIATVATGQDNAPPAQLSFLDAAE